MRDDLSWIQTYTGKAFWPLDPLPDDVDIRDIAHHLSMICRFAGATREFYSVAQHSVLVSRNVPTEDALWGLLHDATEAYMIDLPRPIKRHNDLRLYRLAEDRLMDCLANHFGLVGKIPMSVHDADKQALWTERRDLLGPCDRRWDAWEHEIAAKAWVDPIESWRPAVAERLFLDRYEELTGTRV